MNHTFIIKLLWLAAISAIKLSEYQVLAQYGLANLAGFVGQLAGGSAKQTGGQASRDSGPEAIVIMRSRGFIGEMYKIRSSDGAPLTLYHMINPLADPAKLNKYPVVIFHGLAGDATMMISNAGDVVPLQPALGATTLGAGETSLAFLLCNNNYDVWLMDARGTNLNNHEASDDFDLQKSQKFWNYALDEQVQNDVPTLINFVLEQTQSKKVMYVGYSESTFFLFALLSAQPEFADKIAAFVALAPVAFVAHLRGLTVPMMAPYSLIPDEISGNYLPQPLVDSLGVGVRRLCGNHVTSQTLCATFARGVAGQTSSSEDTPEFFASLLHTTSLKVFKHFLQLFTQRRFGMYDYGPRVNMIKYGKLRPPDYLLGRIRLPTIILVRGGNDYLSTPEDQQTLIDQLGSKPFLDIQLPNYNHLDFIVAKDVAQRVNVPIITTLYHILVAEGDSPLRNGPPIKVHQPYKVAYPNRDGSVASKPVQGNQHLLGNLFDALEYKRRLDALPIIGNTITGLLGRSGALEVVKEVGVGADRLGDSLANLPDPIG